MKRVVVGLSGGVDSSVAAYLLKQQGYEVIAIFMKNWHDDSVTISKECPWLDDSNDAIIIADTLEIPFQTIDLSDSYKKLIVDYMFNEYKQGRTPNPDVLCNREIKFDIFLKIAMDLDADYIATGHYCRKKVIKKDGCSYYRLLAGKDNNKDQSYFLCQLSQNQLEKALFPLGNITKQEVRKIAEEQNLITANKKDSQGLCFIGKVKLPEFLQQKLAPKEGNIIEIDKNNSIYSQPLLSFHSEEERLAFKSKKYNYKPSDGEVVGKHQGAHYFTKGQRKGLNIGGKAEPVFVIDTDVETNTIYIGQGKNHPGLYHSALFIDNEDIHWVRPDLSLEIGNYLNVLARIRYRQSLQNAILYKIKEGLYIDFKDPQSAITKGQFAAWYIEHELIGSGVIS